MNALEIFDLFNKIATYGNFTIAKNLMKTCKTLLNHVTQYRHDELVRYESTNQSHDSPVGVLFVKCCTHLRYFTIDDVALHNNLQHMFLTPYVWTTSQTIRIPHTTKILTLIVLPRVQKNVKWEEVCEQNWTQLLRDNSHIEELHIDHNPCKTHYFSFDFEHLKKIVAKCFLSVVPSTICHLQSVNLPISILKYPGSYTLLEELHLERLEDAFDMRRLINLKKLTITCCKVKIDLPKTVYYLSINNLSPKNMHLLHLNHQIY